MKRKEKLVKNGLLKVHTGIMFYGQSIISRIGLWLIYQSFLAGMQPLKSFPYKHAQPK